MKSHLLRTMLILTVVFLITGNMLVHAQKRGRSEQTVKPFIWLQTGLLNEDGDNNHPSFIFKRARFGLAGKAAEKVDYHFMVEAIHGAEFDPKLYQAWIGYRLDRDFSLRVGQFKYPFGIEAYPGFPFWKFIDASYVTNGIVKELGRNNPGEASGIYRDIGIEIAGRHRFDRDYSAGYKFMIMNGNGINTTDDNDNKDFVFHGNLQTPGNVGLGISFYSGAYDEPGETSSSSENAFGFDFVWNSEINNRDLRIQAELMAAVYDTQGGDPEPWGYYVFGTYYFTRKIELGMRYDFYEPDELEPAVENYKRVTLLFGYNIAKDQIIRINLDMIDDESDDIDYVFQLLCQIAI